MTTGEDAQNLGASGPVTGLMLFCCIVLAALIAWFSQQHVTLIAAMDGYSPIGMMHPWKEFPAFSANFPNGEAEMMKSVIGRVYRLLGAWAVPDRAGATAVVFAEVLVMFGGSVWFSRAANPHLPRWMAYAGGLFLVAGGIASSDFGRWFHPVYGSVYNFALGTGMASIAASMERKGILSGFLLGICATIHPTIALFTAVPVAAMVLTDWNFYRLPYLCLSGLAAAIPMGIWYQVAFQDANIAAHQIDPQQFLTLTRLMSSHWHPLELGIFGSRAWEVLMPSTALFLVTAAVMACGPSSLLSQDRRLALGMGLLIVISLVGLIISETVQSPFLIKFALQRGSLIALLMAAALSMPRVLALVLPRVNLLAIAAAAIVAIPFARQHGLPLAFALIFLALLFADQYRQQTPRRLAIVGVCAILGTCLLLGLVISGYGTAVLSDNLTTFWSMKTPAFIAVLSLIALGWRYGGPVSVGASLIIGALLWLPQTDKMNTNEVRSKASAFMEAQLWARANTPAGSVFMVEPTVSYGWRQYSSRPSFGTFREWLYAGWIYNTDPIIMQEGLRRASLLGADWNRIVSAEKGEAGGYAGLLSEVTARYNKLDAAELSRFAHENGIAYFVFDRKNWEQSGDMHVIYANERFAVVKP